MTEYEIEDKLKELGRILDNVKQLSQKIKDYNNLIALDDTSSPDKTEVLSIFDNILYAIKFFECEDDRDIVISAEAITEEIQDAKDSFAEDYLTDAEIDAYIESFNKEIEEISANLSAEEFRPQQRSYDHSEFKEARYE